MTHDLFRRGGPHNVRKTGPNQYSLQVELPTDAVGMTARECVSATCSPGSFKIKNGTGLTGKQSEAFCPYCRASAKPDDFATREQIRYAQDVAMSEAHDGIERMVKDALGLGPSGKRKFGGGLVSMEMSYKPGRRAPVRRPWEEQLRRDVTCPHCTLEHAVYGLAVWCPDCGEDIFITHVKAESQVLRAMLNDVERRNAELGPRVAARDIENGLEDVVSIMEAALKAMARRRLLVNDEPAEAVNAIMAKKVRNRFQSYDGVVETLGQLFSIDAAGMLDPSSTDRLRHTLEKRHPITHNLGIVDRKYLDKVRTGESEGRDVSLDEGEVIAALDTVLGLVQVVHASLFPSDRTTDGQVALSQCQTGRTD